MTGALERFLLRAGERVIRVHPKLMAGERKVARQSGKSDVHRRDRGRAGGDSREDDLPVAHLAGPGARDRAGWSIIVRNLVAERTRVAAGCAGCLHDLDPGLQPPERGLNNAAALARLDDALAGSSRSRRSASAGELVAAPGPAQPADRQGSRASSRRWSGAVTRGCSRSRAAASSPPQADPGQSRQRRPLPDRGQARQLRRRRADGRAQLGPPAAPPPQPRRQPPASTPRCT